MTNQAVHPTPITLITGFLGAGKTTLLNRILNDDHGLRVAVLVNDFGAINIDAKLVVGVEGETVSLSNGCICCTIRGDLLEAVEALLSRDIPPEYIIIEASGVSDPSQVVYTFIKSPLKDRVQIDAILTLVDAEQLRALDKNNQRLADDQIRAADIVILNKIDLVSQAQLNSVKHQIHKLVPQARILETTQARVPINVIVGIGKYDITRLPQTPADVHIHHADEQLHQHHSHDHSLVFTTWHWTSSIALSLPKLRQVIENLPGEIYRAKGHVYLGEIPDKQGVLQIVGRRVSLSMGDAWHDKIPYSEIVFISSDGGIKSDELAEQLDSCTIKMAENTDSNLGIGTVFKWLRLK